MVDKIKHPAQIQNTRIEGNAPAPAPATPETGRAGNQGQAPNLAKFQQITGGNRGRVGLAGRARPAQPIEVNGVRLTAAEHFSRLEEFGDVKIPTPVLEQLLYS